MWFGASIGVTGVSRHGRTLVQLFHSRMGPSANSSKSGASSSGLLSNVFGFFSREIESFVVNAAGGSAQASHAKRDRERVQHRILIHLSQQSSEPGPSDPLRKPKRAKKKSRRANDVVYASPPHPKRGKGPRRDERGRRPATSERSPRSGEPDAPHTSKEPGEPDQSYLLAVYPIHPLFYLVFLKPPIPVPREKTSLKPPVVTMPGSLFPRSPSMFPDFAPALQTPRIQRVSNNTSPPALKQLDAGPHPTPEDHHAEADVSSGALSQWLRRGSSLTLACRGGCSDLTQTLRQGKGETEGCGSTIRS